MDIKNNKHLTNYHSHCDFCDGHASMEEFVGEAINQGFTAYGISSHAPLPDSVGHSKVLQWDRVADYLAEIERLKIKYADRIELYAGMEIDYIDSAHCPANNYFQGLRLDYRIGSVHFLKTSSGRIIDADTAPAKFVVSLREEYDNDIERLIRDYFDAKMRMIASGGFDFVGHADKVSMNASKFREGITQETWYRNLVREYFAFIGKQQMMLEVNTKAFHANGFFFPNEENFSTLLEFRIPVVVNSDAHSPHLVNSGRFEAIERLAAVGYRSIREMHQGRWVDVEI